jgi:hypothetical protein
MTLLQSINNIFEMKRHELIFVLKGKIEKNEWLNCLDNVKNINLHYKPNTYKRYRETNQNNTWTFQQTQPNLLMTASVILGST